MNVEYVTSKCVPVADCLSRLINAKSAQEDETLNLKITNLGVEPVKIDWNNIRKFTMIDPTLVRLAKVIQMGWPYSGKDLPNDVKLYFHHQYELHIVDGVIFLQNRIVVPIGLKHQFITKLHESHMGVVKSKLLARTLVYWPNWNDEIKKTCAECRTSTCPTTLPVLLLNLVIQGRCMGWMSWR